MVGDVTHEGFASVIYWEEGSFMSCPFITTPIVPGGVCLALPSKILPMGSS